MPEPCLLFGCNSNAARVQNGVWCEAGQFRRAPVVVTSREDDERRFVKALLVQRDRDVEDGVVEPAEREDLTRREVDAVEAILAVH